MEQFFLTPISLDALLNRIQKVVRDEINVKQETELKGKFLSPAKTVKLFDPPISLVTLNKWASEGLLKKHYIGGRTYYRYDQVCEAVKHLAKYKKVQTH